MASAEGSGCTRSDIWDHYTKSVNEGVTFGSCNYCKKLFKCLYGSTSSLRNHLKTVHTVYDEEEGSVDVVDEMIDIYRTKVCTRRWPMVVFYTVIDIAALNTSVVWLHKYPNWKIKILKERRRRFLKELGMAHQHKKAI